MNNSGPYRFTQKSFPFFLRRSTYIHAILVLSTLTGGKILYEIQQRTRNENLELIQASVRVDMVAMPTHTLNELKNLSSGVEEAKKEEPAAVEKPAEKEVAKEEPKEVKEEPAKANVKDDTPSFEEAKAQQKRQDFLSKLKKIGSKKVESAGNQKSDQGLYGERESDLKKLVLSGNKLSRGTQMYGEGSAAEMTAYQAYTSRLPDLVRSRWTLPDFLLRESKEKKLKCRIQVWINMNGEVSRTQVYQSSGNSDFDQRAIDAIKGASPFPPLSEEFAQRAQRGDIVLGFPL